MISGGTVVVLNARRRKEKRHLDQKVFEYIGAAKTGLMLLDSDLRITYVNQTMAKMSGFGDYELKDSLFEILVAEPERGIETAALKHYFIEKDPDRLATSREFIMQKKDRTRFPCELFITRLEDDGKAVLFATVMEITERYEAQMKMKEAKHIAEEANLAKSMFLANMSHELRTPMNSIIGYSNQLLKNSEKNLSDRQTSFVHRVAENASNLLQIINSVLDISKMEAGKTEIVSGWFDLSHFLNDLGAEMECLATNKGLEFQLYNTKEPIQIETDGEKLRQIFVNLAGNAVKFTGKGTVAIGVEIEHRKAVAITVLDTGIGIPPDELKNIFVAFHQVDPTARRKYEGTGLGLAISYNLCSLMGFELRVDSVIGKGSIFTIDLEPKLKKESLSA